MFVLYSFLSIDSYGYGTYFLKAILTSIVRPERERENIEPFYIFLHYLVGTGCDL